MLAFKNEDGKWLVVKERHTHTGHHIVVSYSDDINDASAGIILPMRLRNVGLIPVEVEVTRTVKIIS